MVQRKSQAQARRLRLLSLLSDGTFQSGEKLARRLRVSRAAVWKLIHNLQDPEGGFPHITGVTESGGRLYFGSLSEDAIGEMGLR